MVGRKKFTEFNVETLILVAVWESPFIFQGCFKITERHCGDTVLLFFRCLANYMQQSDIFHNDFSSEQYQFTHLYNEQSLINLGNLEQMQEDSLYLLKYALHITLEKMLSSRKMYFTSIDDIAMQALINKVRPILNKELTYPEEDHIGFAVAMDYCPKEEADLLAVLNLFINHKKFTPF